MLIVNNLTQKRQKFLIFKWNSKFNINTLIKVYSDLHHRYYVYIEVTLDFKKIKIKCLRHLIIQNI